MEHAKQANGSGHELSNRTFSIIGPEESCPERGSVPTAAPEGGGQQVEIRETELPLLRER